MKKLFVFAMAVAMSLSVSALNNKKVYNAQMKTMDEMLSYGQKQATQTPDGKFISDMYAQLGVELPTDPSVIATTGTVVKKEGKLQKGDVVFFCSAENRKQIEFSGVVYRVNGDNYDILHMSARGAILSNSKDPGFKGNFLKGVHITSDKELQKASKVHEKAIKDSEKQTKKMEKAQIEHDKQAAKIEKQQKQLEKEQQKLEMHKANLEKEKAKDAELKKVLE